MYYGMKVNSRGEIRFTHKGFRFIIRNTPDGDTVTLRCTQRSYPDFWDGSEREMAVQDIPVNIIDELLLSRLAEAFATLGVLV